MFIMKRILLSLIILTLIFPSAIFAQGFDFDRAELPDGVRVNSIGFLPDSPKFATVVGDVGERAKFLVVNKKTGKTVFRGKSGKPFAHDDTGEMVRIIDFSRLKKQGEYYLKIKGLPDSASFQIGNNIYNSSMFTNMIGFYGQRCGVPVHLEYDGIVFEKQACHLEDGYLDFYNPEQTGEIKDGTGGWHDAGDYGKYIVNAAFSTGIMLAAWENFGEKLKHLKLPIPESGGVLPDYLAEIKFNLDWMLKMQFEDGRVSHKLTRQNFSPMVMPSEDKDKRFYVSWGTDATACFAAVTAQAARVFAEYDPEYAELCKEAAVNAMEANKGRWYDVLPDQSEFRTGGYRADSKSDRAWAAAEYWRLTGDDTMQSWLLRSYYNDDHVVDVDFDWGEGRNLGAISYLNSKREGDPRIIKAIQDDLILAADRTLKQISEHGYGRGLRSYYWGCNGGVVRLAFNLYAAYEITNDQKYLDAILMQLDYVYGRNPYGRSFVTGEGHQPPMFPHHRPSVADGIEVPWPGHLVGGANPGEADWHDITADARTNENAINWDASLSFALAIFYMPDEK